MKSETHILRPLVAAALFSLLSSAHANCTQIDSAFKGSDNRINLTGVWSSVMSFPNKGWEGSFSTSFQRKGELLNGFNTSDWTGNYSRKFGTQQKEGDQTIELELRENCEIGRAFLIGLEYYEVEPTFRKRGAILEVNLEESSGLYHMTLTREE